MTRIKFLVVIAIAVMSQAAIAQIRYNVYNLKDLNTDVNDFGAIQYKDGLVFVSERPYTLVNEEGGESNNYTKVFFTQGKSLKDSLVFKKYKSFSPIINLEYHNGPVTFNKEQNVIYFNRVNEILKKKKDNFVNHPKIYSSKFAGGTWREIEPFFLNSDNYSCGHPSLSKDGKTLFFISNIDGGYGGTDIYYCKMENGKWGNPVNLGPEVNSAGIEYFPYIADDTTIYFSSNGIGGGLGELDIYRAVLIDGKWTKVTNQGPFNSSSDDFCVVFNEDGRSGYLSSNRPGGKGGDDIYAFKALNYYVDMEGRILLSNNINDPAANVKIKLLSEDGEFIKDGITDDKGHFLFPRLLSDRFYKVEVDKTASGVASNFKTYLADKNDRSVRVVDNFSDSLIQYQTLPADLTRLATLEEMSITAKKISFSGNILTGDNSDSPLADKKINLTNAQGEIIQTTTTNIKGEFEFSNLPADQNFLVSFDAEDTEIATYSKVVMVDKKGNTTLLAKRKDSDFQFEILASDKNTLGFMEAEDSNLRVDFKGTIASENDNAPLSNQKVSLYNKAGEVVQTTTTNSKGDFVFSNIPYDQNYVVKLDATDSEFAQKDGLVMTNLNGKEVSSAKNEKGEFNFEILSNDFNTISMMSIDDTQLRVDFKGTLQNGDTKKPLANAKIFLYDDKGKVVSTTVTTAYGKFSFKNLSSEMNYVLNIDEKDPQFAKIRTIVLISESGEVIKTFTKGSDGKFKFEMVSAEQKMLAAISEPDTWLKASALLGKEKSNLRIIESIYYNYGDWKILPEAIDVLDNAVNLMKKNPNVTIELSAHTDSRSSSSFNMTLSQKRANTAVQYFISKGIDKKRITGKGYGETMLTNKCKDGVECSEAEHAKNRRTEFKIKYN